MIELTENQKPNKNSYDLEVTISSPEDTLWLGTADAVSSENSQGKFDILPQHANFITILENQEVVIRTKKGEQKKFKITRGVLYCHEDKISIYSEV
jgi:F0F1-type ATP synthase epsilon subunit